MKEYKKSYLGLWLWVIGFCAASFSVLFFPEGTNNHLLIFVITNVISIGIFILLLMIYLLESVYWINGTTFEAAEKAGSERRKEFAMLHVKPFAFFAAAYLVYSTVSLLVNFPFGIDIAINCIGIIVAAFSTLKYKL